MRTTGAKAYVIAHLDCGGSAERAPKSPGACRPRKSCHAARTNAKLALPAVEFARLSLDSRAATELSSAPRRRRPLAHELLWEPHDLQTSTVCLCGSRKDPARRDGAERRRACDAGPEIQARLDRKEVG